MYVCMHWDGRWVSSGTKTENSTENSTNVNCRHVQWPGRDPRPIKLMVSSSSGLAAPQSIPGTHASSLWRVCLSAHF
jgi:hypothetical protein